MDSALAEAVVLGRCVAACFVEGLAVMMANSTWALAGLLPQHALVVIWSLGHWEIADNLDENGWKIAVFRPLIPSSFIFFVISFFISSPFPLPTTKLL